MSVYYSIKEHLKISREIDDYITPADEAIEIMRGNLAILASLVMLGDGDLFDLHMTADGTEYSIKDNRIDGSFWDVLDAMKNARDLDLSVEYEYRWTAGWQAYNLVGPFGMMEFMENPDGEDMSGIFYSAWNHADSGNGPGKLVAYGENRGKTYHGIVDFITVPEIPSGIWRNSDTVIYLDPDEFNADAHPNVIPLCKELMEISDDATLKTDGSLDFCVDNVTLKSPEQGKRFLEAALCLQKLMPEDFSMIADFTDCSGDDVRLMTIDETEDGYVVKIAETASASIP